MKIRPLRDALEDGILSSIPNTELNGHKEQRLANTTNITFRGIESEALLILSVAFRFGWLLTTGD